MSGIVIDNYRYTKLSDNRVHIQNIEWQKKGIIGGAGWFEHFKNSDDADKFISSKIEKAIKKGNATNKPKSPLGKKIGVGVAACVYPGLGQAVNGQWGKAAGFVVGGTVAGTIGFLLGGPLVGALCAYAVNVASVYDAVKNA